MTLRLRLAPAAVLALCALPSLAATHSRHAKPRPEAELPAPTALYSFTSADTGSPLGNIIQARDGNFYGVTSDGSSNGTIYQITPAGAKTTVYTFSGEAPAGGLFSGPDGNLYGLARNGAGGGVYGFNIARAEVFFTSTLNGAAAEGLTQDANGNLYGLTTNGGTDSLGSIVQVSIGAPQSGNYPPTVTVTTLYSFTFSADPRPDDPGYSPTGTPLVASDGNLYGYTTGGSGDDNALGTIWRYALAAKGIHAVADFQTSFDGYGPIGGPVEASDGNIYGLLQQDSNANEGGIFQVAPSSGAATTWTHQGGDPDYPFAGGVPLVTGTGDLITAGGGGANNDGALNDINVMGLGAGGNTADDNVDLYDFTNSTTDGGNPKGEPSAGILSNGHGVLLGTDTTGGATGLGEVYVFDETGNDTPVITLTTSTTTVEAGSPITLNWNVTNAFSASAQTCYAFSSDYSFSGKLPGYSGSMQVTPVHPGTKLYAITCGGVESAVLSLPVTNGDITLTNSSGDALGSPVSFGAVPESSSASQTYTVTNNAAIVFPFSITVSGETSSTFSHTTTCPAQIESGKSCTVTFTYDAPATAQQDQATFTIAKNGFRFPNGNTATLDARSVAPGVITLSATTHQFGDVDKPVSYTFEVYNGTGSTQPFSETATQVSGPAGTASSTTTCPSTLVIDQSCSVTVSFSTTSAGAFQVNDTISTTAAVKPGKTVKLYGTVE